ncbi:hypothetical protein H4R19_000479 [Coemansia spiralis]|nr:hypothetical protein H4R19_000479 [Coemansia spiralis]
MDSGSDSGMAVGRFMKVPEDVLLQILARLDPRSLDEAAQVCRLWHRIVSNDHSWLRVLILTLGRRPFQRLQPGRMPSTRIDTPGWLASGRPPAPTWRSEHMDRLGLHKLWTNTNASHHRRIEFNPRVSTIDGLVVSERHGWALAVSKLGRAAVRCLPQSGKVFARDDNVDDIVFAAPNSDAADVTAIATRIDRILWGLGDGCSTVTHLTRGGGLKARVVAAHQLPSGVTAVAGPFDRLAQEHHEWSAAAGHGGADDLVASACAGGSVLVWSATTGDTHRILHGMRDVRLTQVTWADAGRYVVAAAEDKSALFVWDLESPGSAAPDALTAAFDRVYPLSPDASEYADGSQPPSVVFAFPGRRGATAATRLVLLAGDPYGNTFIVATATGGVARISVTGAVQATYELGPAKSTGKVPAVTVTAATWKLDVAPIRSPSSASLSDIGSERHEIVRPDPVRAAHDAGTRLLLVGDATGGVHMFDGDGDDVVPALQRWPRLHRRAVAALTVNAAIVVSAGCDGQLFVLDPLSGQTLCADRCRSGRRSDAGGPVDPWFWSVHPALRGPQTALEVHAARQLASEPAAWWDDQSAEQLPTLVTEVRAGYGWLVAANRMYIHATFAGLPGKSRRQRQPRRPERAGDMDWLLEEGMAEARAESAHDRAQRLRAHERRTHVEREYEAPAAELGLSIDEQLAYALWLSTHGDASPPQPPANAAVDGMTEDEQLAYALRLSQRTP